MACGLWPVGYATQQRHCSPGAGYLCYGSAALQVGHQAAYPLIPQLFVARSQESLLPSWRSLVNPSGAVTANGRCTPPLTTLDWLLRRRIASARNSMSCLHLATDVLVVTTRFAGPRQFEVFACMQDAAGSEGLACVVGAMTSPRQRGLPG